MRSEILQTWRRSLVSKLQENYGLPEEEARTKVDAWLQWVTQDTQPQETIDAPLTRERSRRPPPPSRTRQMTIRQPRGS
jgi:hypothetical protein